MCKIPFQLLLTIFSRKPVDFHKHKCIAMGAGTLECIVEPEEKDEFNPTVEATTVQYKEVHDLQTQIERHMKAELQDSKYMVHNWRREIKIDAGLMHISPSSMR